MENSSIKSEDYEGPWVQIGIDTPIAFKERKVIFDCEGYKIIWFNGNQDYYPSIAIPIKNKKDPTDYKKELEIGSRFLSVLAFKYKRPILRLGGYSAGSGVTHYQRKLGNHIFPVPISTTFELPKNPKKKRALALYREGLDYRNAFYGFLCLYRILGIPFKDGSKEQIDWINKNVDKVRDGIARRRLKAIREKYSDIAKYLYESGRCALAHAKSDPTVDPDNYEDYARIWEDKCILEDLARIMIESNLLD